MGVCCAVYGCLSSTNDKTKRKFYRFPLDELRCRQWISAAGRTDLESMDIKTLNNRCRICDLHFVPSDHFQRNLKHNAVPSLNLPQLENDDKLSKYTQTDVESNCFTLDIRINTPSTLKDNIVGTQTVQEMSYNTPRIRKLLPEASGVKKVGPHSRVHTGYQCNLCQGDIVRFRYACVECTNFELCGACEARGYHPTHYVLRVPANKEHVEVQAILENIRNVLLKRGDDHSSEPEIKVEYPEQCIDAERDPLAPSDHCHHSEIQIPTKEQSLFSQTGEIKQSTIDDAATISITTEPVGSHSHVVLYSNTNTGPEESQKAPYSQLKTCPSSEETLKASQSLLKTWASNKETKPSSSQPTTGLSDDPGQKACCLKSRLSIEETQKASHSRLETLPSNEETQKASHSPLEALPSNEETQKASHSRLETWPSNEDTRKASHIRLETFPSNEETQKASHSRLETCERLRVTALPAKGTAEAREGAAGDCFAVYTHREPPHCTSQGVAAREEAGEQSPSGAKRKSRLELLVLRPKIRK